MLRGSCLPAVGAVLRRPAPLRLVAVLSVSGGLGLTTTGLHVTAGNIATGWLWAGAVATSSSCGEWWVRAVVAARSSGEWRVRSMAVTVIAWRVGGGVRNDYGRSLAVSKSNSGSLGGA